MSHTRALLGRLAGLAAFAAALSSIAGLTACKPYKAGDGAATSALAEYEQSRKQYAGAVERLFREAEPVTDRPALAARLKLSPARFAGIGTGPRPAGQTVVAFDSDKDCPNGNCRCVGDRDCNKMFSTVCAHESTGGQCETAGSQPICTCQITADTPTPTEKE